MEKSKADLVRAMPTGELLRFCDRSNIEVQCLAEHLEVIIAAENYKRKATIDANDMARIAIKETKIKLRTQLRRMITQLDEL